ncbi:MAG: ParA family protein [Holosporaceae bacterium]|jgi:chromosome partitioning protein|nr:ParA family protein [Holosporaceae bacterium]
MIVIVSSEKGGWAGKTTIATNLAIIRARKGTDVFLIDADSQRSAVIFLQLES